MNQCEKAGIPPGLPHTPKTNRPQSTPQKGETGYGLFGMDVREYAREQGKPTAAHPLPLSPKSTRTALVLRKIWKGRNRRKRGNIKCDGNIEKGHRTATCQQSGREPTLPFMLVFASFYAAAVLGPRLSSTRTAAASRAGSRMTPRETHSMVWAWERDAWASVTPAAAKWRREERISVNSRM